MPTRRPASAPEKTDWSNVAYREEAVRRVEERRETQKMLEVWEARRLTRLTAIENVTFGAMTDLYMATTCYSFRDNAVVGKLVKDAQEALAVLQRYALAETTKWRLHTPRGCAILKLSPGNGDPH